MLLTRTFAQRRTTYLGLAAALAVCAFLAMPQGRAFASSLLLLFRGQTIQPIATSYANLENAYQTLEELEKLGSLQGTPPEHLNVAASISAAGSTAGLTPRQPSALPAGFSATPVSIKALAPSTSTLTLHKSTADAYFQSIGSSMTLPAQYDGEQIIVSFPGVTLVEYSGTGNGRLLVGQAGQMQVQTAGNATADQLRSYLLQLPGLSPATATALQNISNWQYTIPLGIPTDKTGFTTTNVGGSNGGSGVILNDNTGIFSAVLWQHNQTQSFGIAGKGVTANELQSLASSLH